MLKINYSYFDKLLNLWRTREERRGRKARKLLRHIHHHCVNPIATIVADAIIGSVFRTESSSSSSSSTQNSDDHDERPACPQVENPQYDYHYSYQYGGQQPQTYSYQFSAQNLNTHTYQHSGGHSPNQYSYYYNYQYVQPPPTTEQPTINPYSKID